jgi:hypothetical protein
MLVFRVPDMFIFGYLFHISGHETDYSSIVSAEVKNTWIYTSTPPYVLLVQCLIS